MRNQRVPTYRRQRGNSRDRAFVRLNGQRFYLGKYGSPESKEKYRRLIAEWKANHRQILSPSDDLTVVELIAHFWQHAQTDYRRPNDTPTSEIDNYRQALRLLKNLYGHTLANAFGPKSLKMVRCSILEKQFEPKLLNNNPFFPRMPV